MNCEEFQAIGLDAGTRRIAATEEADVAAHASVCAKCAALAESWESARAELAVFADATRSAEAPARVQMRLLQELRTQKRPHLAYRRAGVIAAWSLAAAAAVVGVVSRQSWHPKVKPLSAQGNAPAVNVNEQSPASDAVLIADEDTGNFTPLPGALPIESDSGAVYEVRMQRASLGALGLPVNEEGASDWINVDLLVADDGTPQGVRLHEDASQSPSL